MSGAIRPLRGRPALAQQLSKTGAESLLTRGVGRVAARADGPTRPGVASASVPPRLPRHALQRLAPATPRPLAALRRTASASVRPQLKHEPACEAVRIMMSTCARARQGPKRLEQWRCGRPLGAGAILILHWHAYCGGLLVRALALHHDGGCDEGGARTQAAGGADDAADSLT